MEGEGIMGKRPLELDWDKLLPTEDTSNLEEEEEPPQVEVVVGTQQSVSMIAGGDEPQHTQDDQLRKISDKELSDTMERIRQSLPKLIVKLPDKGEKLKANLKRHEDEWKRRQRFRPQKDDEGSNKSRQLNTRDSFDSQEGASSSVTSSQSKFATCFFNKLGKKMDSETVNAFDKEASTLNRCDNRKIRSNEPFSSGVAQKRGLSSREASFRSPGNFVVDVEQQSKPYQDQNDICFTAHSPNYSEAGSLAKSRKVSEGKTSSCKSKGKGRPVLLDDEEEHEFKEIIPQVNEIDECMTTKIYYPSRDDPEAVEICYSDMECLAPEEYLTSTIMNFYIRYLQELMSPTEMERHNYHFFNTYFYEKLKEAVLKKNIKEASFVKFRRWWKGINIFKKAYILLPIHENLHWSLVIICIPDKEDESGPILLHLDSLGLHRSKSIFSNIKSFLIEEWNFLKGGEDLLDLPISDSVWERLSRRIEEKEIEVPQQRNDYDCGLFVLFFMQRFIEEAPKRLKKRDLAMFGKRWFCPEEASSLREYIRNMLEFLFIEASKKKQSSET